MERKERRTRTMFSVKDMFQYAEQQNPTDKIYINDRTVDSLMEFLSAVGRAEPGGKNISIAPDILFAGLMKFRDCEVTWVADDNKSGDCFRVVMFPKYMDILNNADDSVAVFGFFRIGPMLVPLGVQRGDEAIGFGDVFFENGVSTDSNDPSLAQNGIPFTQIVVGLMAVWYALEIAAIDPMTRDLFGNSFPAVDRKPIHCYIINGNDIYDRINELKGGRNNG